MGQKGPLPIPHARRRNKREDVGNAVRVGSPTPPRNLKGEARAEWQRVVPELEAIGVLAVMDRAVLIRYCMAWAEWCDLQKKVEETGMLIKGRLDTLVRNPLVLLRNDAGRTLADLGKELALTPNARLRAGLKHEAPEAGEGKQLRVTAIEDYRKRLDA